MTNITKNWGKKDLSAAEVEYFKSFYQSHSIKETQEHFGISVKTIYNRLDRFNFPRTKTETFEESFARIDKDKLAEYYKKHTLEETRKYFDISGEWLSKLIKYYKISKRPESLEELARRISKEELEEYYFNHSQEETRLYFNEKYSIPSPYTVVSLMYNYYKIDKLNNSKKRIKEYLDTVEKTNLHEIADALNLGYSNVTHLVKQIDAGDKIVYTPAGSTYETEIENFLKALNVRYERQSRNILENGLELDFYLLDYKIGIEVNGDYWHSSLFKTKMYHLNKSKQAAEQNIRLIHIWSHEWDDLNTREKIKDIIKVSVGIIDRRIFARKCEVKEIDKAEAKIFLNKYHLDNYRSANMHFGLYYNNELVQVMTFSSKAYGAVLELVSECSANGIIVIGGKSKLFKHCIQVCNPEEILIQCDFNKFNGNSYKNLNATFIGHTSPDVKWLLKTKEVKKSVPQRDKESIQAKLFGCGALKYVYKRVD